MAQKNIDNPQALANLPSKQTSSKSLSSSARGAKIQKGQNQQGQNQQGQISQIFVNNKIILQSEINARFNFFLQTAKIKASNSQNINSLRDIIITRMIEEELVRQKAPAYKIIVDDQELNEQMEAFIARNFSQQKFAGKKIADLSNFKNFLSKNNWQFADFQKQIEAELIWKKIVENVIKPTISVSHIEIKEWLEKEKLEGENYKYLLQDFVIGDVNKNAQLINSIYQEFKNNRDKKNATELLTNLLFLNLENEGDEAIWFWSSELNNQILPKITNLKNNDFSEPILLNDGWHIFKLYNKKIDLNISPQEYDFIKNQITNRKLEVAIKNYLQDLKKRAYIEYR